MQASHGTRRFAPVFRGQGRQRQAHKAIGSDPQLVWAWHGCCAPVAMVGFAREIQQITKSHPPSICCLGGRNVCSVLLPACIFFSFFYFPACCRLLFVFFFVLHCTRCWCFAPFNSVPGIYLCIIVSIVLLVRVRAVRSSALFPVQALVGMLEYRFQAGRQGDVFFCCCCGCVFGENQGDVLMRMEFWWAGETRSERRVRVERSVMLQTLACQVLEFRFCGVSLLRLSPYSTP